MRYPVSNADGADNRPQLREVNHCHGKGKGHPCTGAPSAIPTYTPKPGVTNRAKEMLDAGRYVFTSKEAGHNILSFKVEGDQFAVNEARRALPSAALSLREIAGRMIQDVDERFNVHIQPMGPVGHRSLLFKFVGEKGTQMARYFIKGEGRTFIAEHDLLKIPDGSETSAKDLVRNQVGLYRDLGVNTIMTLANITVGSYAWARYGFLPREPGVAAKDLLDEKKYQLTGDEVSTINTLMGPRDEKWVWRVADSPIGKKALIGGGWEAYLDLTNPEQTHRLLTYVGAIR